MCARCRGLSPKWKTTGGPFARDITRMQAASGCGAGSLTRADGAILPPTSHVLSARLRVSLARMKTEMDSRRSRSVMGSSNAGGTSRALFGAP